MKHSKYSPYPKYRPSGVHWLGNIPAHWGLTRLKMVADLIDNKTNVEEELPIPFIGMASIESWTGQLSAVSELIRTGVANKFEADHTLFGKLRPYLAKAWNPSFDGLCSTEFLVLKATNIDRRFLLYCILSDGFIKMINSSTYGSKMPRTSWEFIASSPLPLVPPMEQASIVQFLDRESANIYAIVDKMQALVERLQERRTALISRAVTRGIPSNSSNRSGRSLKGALQPSGVEWLGHIKENWKIRKLKMLCSRSALYGANIAANCYTDCGIRFIRTTDITETGELRGNGVYIPEELASGYLLSDGDLLISRSGTVGRSFLYDSKKHGPCAYAGYLVRFVPKSRVLSRYIYWFTRSKSFQVFLELMSISSTIDNLSGEKYANLPIPIPPIHEQSLIVDHLDRVIGEIEYLISKIEMAADRWNEYRASLVTATVTGAIDVRSLSRTVADEHAHYARRAKFQEQSVAIGTVSEEHSSDLSERTSEPDSIRHDVELGEHQADLSGRVPVKPALLKWARERAHYSLRDMSECFPNVAAWERGEAQPTYRQLEALADMTHAPIGYFFLPEPPVEPMPIPDLRSVASGSLPRPSPDLLDTIYHCQRQQNWYLEFVQSEGGPRLEFVGSAQVGDDVVETAVRIRKTLGLDLDERAGRFDCEDSFRSLIDHADARGILVMLSGVAAGDLRRSLDPWEFRGLALADPLAPLVFVNRADTNAAQMFTLAREFAHLWLGVSGISDADLAGVPAHESEHWCNRVAAEVLVPADALRDELDPCASLQAELNRLSHRFEVSTLVLLRRIYDIGRLSRNELEVAYSAELNRWKWMSKGGGGSPNLTVSGGVSRRFARALMVSTLEGHTGYTEALRLLGLKTMESFDALRRNLEVGF